MENTSGNEKPGNIGEMMKTGLRLDCFAGSIVNGIRQPILFFFALDKPPGHKALGKPRNKQNKKLIKPDIIMRTFYLDVKNKCFYFNEETLFFTLQLIKI